jgi:hypothetical protein
MDMEIYLQPLHIEACDDRNRNSKKEDDCKV